MSTSRRQDGRRDHGSGPQEPPRASRRKHLREALSWLHQSKSEDRETQVSTGTSQSATPSGKNGTASLAASSTATPGHKAPHTRDGTEPYLAPGTGRPSDRIEIYESAYSEAWFSLEEEHRKQLEQGEEIKQLFASLMEDDKKLQDKSIFQNGLLRARPYLDKLRMGIDIVSLFVSAEPVAATALSIVKGAVTLVVAICGAAEQLTNHLESFFGRIAAFERCSEVVKGGSQLPDIHRALVQVFRDTLEFYVLAASILKKRHFTLRLALIAAQDDISSAIDSFNTHTLFLAELLQVETFASVQEIKDEQVDTLIRDTLVSGMEIEIARHNELKHRSDEPCKWVVSEPAFISWKDGSIASVTNDAQAAPPEDIQGLEHLDPSKLLVMFGDMGVGKTVTAAYVVDYLSTEHLVCAYYCNDNQETTKLVTIYRSLLRQLLQQAPELKLPFWRWYRQTEKRSQIPPMQSESELRRFLCEAISSSHRQVFLVLDGLDECENAAQMQLLAFLTRVLNPATSCKAFISSRRDADIESALPPLTLRIELRPSLERDRMIAHHLAVEIGISPGILETAADQLSKIANGSAIWLRIAIEYLAKSRIKSEKGFEKALERLSSYKGLAELYTRLFEKVCLDVQENADTLKRALETLGVAGRYMSVKELACAIAVEVEDMNATTVAEIEETAEATDLLELILPFISIVNVGSAKDTRLRLVHQSLKELILIAEPSEWTSVGANRSQSKSANRSGDLHSALLQRCVNYLLLDDCGQKELYPTSEAKYNEEVFQMLQMNPYEENEGSVDSDDCKALRDFDPIKVGLGSFFTYAASFWTFHFQNTAKGVPATELMDLCYTKSQRLENWVQQWQRPNCTYTPEWMFPESMERLDPLVITAIFGTSESLANMLKCDLQDPAFLPGSSRIAVDALIALDRTDILRYLLTDETLGSALQRTGFLITAVTGWEREDPTRERKDAEWDAIFGFLIPRLRDDLITDGNEVLCQASSNGCFQMVRKLLDATNKDQELRDAILGDSRWPSRREPNIIHQSVGEAVWGGHINIVRYLCQQEGIGTHLRYLNSKGSTVFHQAAVRCDLDMFRVLVEHWPEGVNCRDHSNDTALTRLIFSHPRGDTRTLETVKFLLVQGGADASGRYDDPGYSPLCTAIRQDKIPLCRLLIVEGSADAACAFGIDPHTGKPFLHEDASLGYLGDEEQMLQALCQLFPLAVSMDFLC